MEFKSQICTTREQSERLLALGLKKETADCMYSVMTKSYNGRYILEEDRQYNLILFHQEEVQSVGFSHYEYIPAWSLHRLLSMLPDDAPNLFWTLNNANISIEQEDGSDFFPHRNSMYDSIIDCMGFLIKEDCFNKDYLEEKK